MQGYWIASALQYPGGYAIAKMLGPWNLGDGLEANNLSEGPGELCGSPIDSGGNAIGNNDLLRQFFNDDQNVLAHLNGRPTLHCDGMISTGSGSGFSNGNCSTTVNMQIDSTTGNLQVVSWVLTLINCHSGTLTVHRNWAHEIIELWHGNGNGNGKDPILSISFPSDKDPMLIPVPKTVLEPGLYEFTTTMEDGSILHHYQDFSNPVVVNADFAAFTDINIYPVPVKDSFAADFDLLVPMDIALTVMDNMGHTYYQEALHFLMAGRNKHVVKMDQQWPNGLYHAIFQYADGSSETLNFIVGD